MRNLRKYDAVAVLSLAVFAFLFCYACGSRGFFPLDQSIVYDGAWRIIQGQIPFKDFIAPIGPVVFWWQALLFCLFGASYASYLLGAAVLNSAAAVMSFLLVRKFSPNSLVAPFCSGLLSAVWFYPQIGTTYPDQTAMFLCLSAFFCALSRTGSATPDYGDSEILDFNKDQKTLERLGKLLVFIPSDGKKRFEAADFAAGILWGAAFLTKQNFAVFFLPLLFVSVPFAPPTPKIERLHSFWGGVLFAMGAFVVWLLIFSDWRLFVKYFLAIPINEGLRRLGGSTGAAEIRLNAIVLLANLALASASFVVLAGAARKGWMRRRGDDAPFLAVATLFLITYSYVMIKTTNNNPENAWGFLPLIFGFGHPILERVAGWLGKTTRGAVRVAEVLLLAAVIATGALSAWNRAALDFAWPANFERLAWPPNAAPLQWCDQTPAGITADGRRVVIFKSDVERLTKYLAASNSKFFVFPDFTALYGFVGVDSPQPLLWFHKGLTYSRNYDGTLDLRITSSLKKNDIDTIILERFSWFGTQARLDDFPKLKKFIAANFVYEGDIGIYKILRRRVNSCR